ncbi:MAG: hypothetical protein ABI039_07760 [Vicinamibacterales bacterium]
MEFTARKDFWSEELRSQYCQGLSYRGEGLPIEQWLAEGKIVLGGTPSKIQGEGKTQ